MPTFHIIFHYIVPSKCQVFMLYFTNLNLHKKSCQYSDYSWRQILTHFICISTQPNSIEFEVLSSIFGFNFPFVSLFFFFLEEWHVIYKFWKRGGTHTLFTMIRRHRIAHTIAFSPENWPIWIGEHSLTFTLDSVLSHRGTSIALDLSSSLSPFSRKHSVIYPFHVLQCYAKKFSINRYPPRYN